MKNNLPYALLLTLSLLIIAPCAQAQDIWTDGSQNGSYSDSGNWSAGVPSSSSDVVIGTMLGLDNVVGLNTGSNITVASFTFASTLNSMSNPPVQVLNVGGEQLTVNGAITNNSAFQNQFAATVNVGANATYAGGSGLLFSNSLNVGHFALGTTGLITIAPDTSLDFDINSLASFGSIGTVTVTGATINILGSYGGHAGDVFDLTSGNFNGATLGSLPNLSAGLSWNTSNFFSNGVLAVVPEPSTYALLLLGGVVLLGLRKRQTISRRLAAVRSK